ncbi:MAG: hypothetical protein KatS3mg110_2981 [Pirellulaceae bacterium]|nr:MAG: hypothetical protein KatS3mg110_2981 [Pirellulaceae bacterium]
MSQPASVRHVEWHEVAPWLLLFRVLSVALSLRVILLGTAGALVSWGGLELLQWGTQRVLYVESPAPGNALVRSAGVVNAYIPPQDAWQLAAPVREVTDWYAGLWQWWRGWLDFSMDWQRLLLWVLDGLWLLVVGSVFGGAIQRIAAARLGRHVWLGPRVAWQHVRKKLLSYWGAPLLPMVALCIGLGLLWLAGLFMRLTAGIAVVALFWPLVLIGTLLWVLLFLGLAFGWPLMWAALGTEQDADAWDAVSRGYASTLQRPFRYALYLVVAVLVGLAGWLLVYHVVGLTLYVSREAVLRAAGEDAAGLRESLFAAKAPSVGLFFGWLIVALNYLLHWISSGFAYGYFFAGATAIYLLLRRDTTQTPIDEVYLGEEDQSLQLPPLPTAPGTGSGPSANA